MPVNNLIAHGIQGVGQDVPNILQATDQRNRQNALLAMQQDQNARANDQNALMQEQGKLEAFMQLAGIAARIKEIPDPVQRRQAAKLATSHFADVFRATGVQPGGNIDALSDEQLDQALANMAALAPQQRGEGFTLPPGGARYDANGNLIAERPREEPPLTPYQQEQLRLSREQLRLQQDKDTRAADKDAREKAADEEKKANRLRNLTAGVDSVLSEVDKAIGIITKGGGTIMPATGFGSGKASEVRGSAAYRLARTIETVKANIGFDRLQAMRDASPTGGALGQVAVQELNSLQNSIASLDQGLEEADVLANLKKVRTHYENWKRAINGEPPLPAAASSGGQVRVNTPEEALALPSGTRFITPDGREKVRP